MLQRSLQNHFSALVVLPMARLSYGPEVKKRSQQLLAVLLDYANDELDCDDVALDGLRSQIQAHWQTEQRLVVRTKVRFLEALTRIVVPPLTGEQIKEALRRLEDFLELLEDNRPNRGGSETWHFTLKLWHPRRDRKANLERFEQEWEQRRSQKSKQSTQKSTTQDAEVAVIEANGDESETDMWWQWCQDVLEAQQYQRLTTNPLTMGDGVAFELDEVYVPLGLVERKQHERRDTEVRVDQGSKLYEAEEGDTAQFALEQFLEQLQQPGSAKRIAIAGEPGAGKTTLLQKLASWLLDQRALPIWISLADLQGASLEQYLLQDWLKAATRKVTVSTELQEALGAQFNQGRVWLLLDAVDEMATEASSALSTIAKQLRGWVADAHVILTCRLNVWDSGKNALETFTTYRNLTFSHGDAASADQVGQFIERWFHQHPTLGDRLQAELDKLERRRIKDVVKNPLRLALLCRAWSLSQGTLPNSKAALYQQFVETIYEWKQDRFPTTLAQRWQLNQALGHLALQGLAQAKTKFRLSQSFVQQVFREQSLELLELALNLGWLNQVGISTASGEKVYAFYHPTFQEYFAAQAIADWRCFLPATAANLTVDLEASPLVFASQWREVILLWLGRSDIPVTEKTAFLQALTAWEDSCGGFYHYQAYFLAAAGLAEFPEYPNAASIFAQLLRWRFGEFDSQEHWHRYPFPAQEGARVALLQSDRTQAIVALEQFIQSTSNFFACWNAAYSLGKTFDQGNVVAIAAMTQLLQTLQSEPLRLQVSESLGRVDPGNALAIATLIELIATTQQNTLRRKAAYALGKLDPGNAIAITTLLNLIKSAPEEVLCLQAAENLLQLDPGNAIATQFIQAHRKPAPFPKPQRKTKSQVQRDPAQAIASLEQRLAAAADASTQRRLACQLGHLQPGHPQAVEILLQLLQSQRSTTLYRRIGENLREILLQEQLPMIVSTLRGFGSATKTDLPQDKPNEKPSSQAQECYKLLWYCAQQLPYAAFYTAWHLK
ncbi:NACHT domain-containing NTPase [Trichocoleus sp. FACHB-262]|uniref:NACHT domain-containing protein n=1 Tax=Trichocoleus sp. FACHB-262 TaxID=2692869 RepID=UPI0018EFF95C|nr:NACHT domain-containing protein [Trichocoleus sp. FACHB-262]